MKKHKKKLNSKERIKKIKRMARTRRAQKEAGFLYI
jgi:hypothetical protein